VYLNCASAPQLLSEVWFDPGDRCALGRAGSNGTPEGWLIFGEGLSAWMGGYMDAWMRELFFYLCPQREQVELAG